MFQGGCRTELVEMKGNSEENVSGIGAAQGRGAFRTSNPSLYCSTNHSNGSFISPLLWKDSATQVSGNIPRSRRPQASSSSPISHPWSPTWELGALVAHLSQLSQLTHHIHKPQPALFESGDENEIGRGKSRRGCKGRMGWGERKNRNYNESQKKTNARVRETEQGSKE